MSTKSTPRKLKTITKPTESPKSAKGDKQQTGDADEQATYSKNEMRDSDDVHIASPEPLENDNYDDNRKEVVEGAEVDSSESEAPDREAEPGSEQHMKDHQTESTKSTTNGDSKSTNGDDSKSVTSGIEKTGSSVLGDVKDVASKGAETTGDLAQGDVNGVEEDATDAVDNTKDTVNGTVNGVKKTTESATGEELPVPDLSILKGLEVDKEGLIHDNDGNAIGRLVEGDAEDLEGFPIGDEGEILDDDGDLVGRTELIPEKAKELAEKAKDIAEEATEKVPGLEILKGLTVDTTGNILNDDGDTVGQLVEGDPQELKGKEFNEKGEILDDEGKVVGRARVHPDYAEQFENAEDAAEDEVEEAGEKAGDAVEETGEAIEEELPGIEALEGQKVDDDGHVIDEAGHVLGQLAEGDIKKAKGMKINEKGEVVDEEGNVIGKVQLADGAQEILAGLVPDLRILEGLKVNKKGKILDGEGDVLGELIDGDLTACAGKKVNDKGEVLDKSGDVIGRVKVVPGDAADEAQKELEERLGELPADTPGLEILDGLKVNKKGKILDEEGDPIGELVDGELSKCAGMKCNEKGEVLDSKGKVIGRVRTLQQETEEGAEEAKAAGDDELPPLSTLEGLKVNKAGKIIDRDGKIVGELVEGDPKKISKLGITADEQGQFWDNKGHVIGKAKTVLSEDSEEEALFAGLEGLIVNKQGMVEDENGNIVGQVVDGDAKKLVGRAVDEDGDIIDKRGTVIGHADRYNEPEQAEEEAQDLSILNGKMLNKQGNVIGEDGVPIGRLVEGSPKELAGRKCDENGLIHNDTGKVVGRCELIPEDERVSRKEGPFGGYDDLRVVKDGKVEDADGNVVGKLVDGDPKRLVGHAVDEDGDIIDKYGNVKGHAEPFEEEEEPEADLSSLAGCTVNKAGNVVDSSGQIIGRVAEGDVKNMVGRKVDGKGQIWDSSGNIVGKAELVQGASSGPEGPFSGYESNTVAKDGTVQTPDGTIIGRVIDGDVKKLVGHKVDEEGDITDKNGNTIGKAERWEPEEKERKINPMAGRKVNKQGEVRDENGDVMGRLTAGDLGHCVGLEIDDSGYVIDNDGNRVGEVTLLENIAEENPEETEDDKKKREDAELANKMADICRQTLERIQPVMKQITEHIEKADRTPHEELDEEELVNNVKPLIEEGHRILQECNGSLRGLDPDGRIASQAKGRAQTREATPEEYRLADLLKELTGSVVTTIDNAKKKISDMPHAKKKLNPLWSLLTEPLFQIIAAVGLLLSGVLGLVGRLLNALGLGGLVNGLLGGLGIDKLLGGLGLGGLGDMLGGGKKKEKKGGASNIPLVGGLLGGGK